MQGGTAQNKKRIIILSLILAVAFVLPSFATRYWSSGDGYTLYRGYKLPSLPEYDESVYPYACILAQDDIFFLHLMSSPPTFFFLDQDYPYVSFFSSTASNYSVYFTFSDEYYWTSYTVNDPNGHGYPIWSNFLFRDYYTKLDVCHPSEPYPLDGYTVLEWDGDTEGLYYVDSYDREEDADSFLYRVTSEILPIYEDSVFAFYGLPYDHDFPSSNYYTGFIVGSDSDISVMPLGKVASVSTPGVSLSDVNSVFPDTPIEYTGTYFSYINSSFYTHLYAYRESETEGPTGAVTGLTIINPPSGTSDFILYAGSDLQCSAEVTGTGDFSSAVSWSVSHGSIGEWYPTISETGLLHIPAGTPEQRIFVTCTSVSDPTFSQTVPVYILPPAVSSVTITPSSATAAPGENIQFSAIVSGSNVQDPDVTWSVGAATSPSTRITRDGLLLIGSDETSPLLGVRATSNQDGSVYSTALVTISVPAAVTGVTISPDDITLNRGDTQQFAATVTGTGSYDNSVTWQITSVYSVGTSISNTGLLTIGEEQKYDYIIIKATSTADPSFSATAYVFVEDALSDPMNIDLSVVERLLEEIKTYLKTLQHIFDRPHYFREFNMYTGKLNETEEQITGLTFNFYRFMQNMEEYVGSIAYTFANGAEVQIREDTTEGFDWFSLFFGKNSSSKVEETDFAGVSTLVNHTRDLFDTGFGFSDFFDLLDTVPFFTNEVGSQLDTTTRQFDFRDPDPFNMSVLGNREDQLEEWRNKHTD